MLRVNVTIQLLVYIFIHMCSDKNLTAYIFAYITYNSLCMSRTSCCGRTVPFRIPLLLLLRCTLNISAAGVCRSMSVCLIHVFWFALRHPFLPFSGVFFFFFFIYLLARFYHCHLHALLFALPCQQTNFKHNNRCVNNQRGDDRSTGSYNAIHTYTNNKHFGHALDFHKMFSIARS